MTRLRELWAGLSTNARRGVVGGAVGVVVVLVVGVALAVSGNGSKKPTPTTTTAATTTTTKPPVTTTTEPPTGLVAPLTGLRVADPRLATRPALAVKIDNLDGPSESAVPQTGIPKADIVFEEIVEGNITRLVGIFQSQEPGVVGPVRSARTTDLQILPQFGRPLLAWSGGNGGVVADVHASPSIIDEGADAASAAYFRDHSRHAPHNLYVHTDQLWARAPAGLPAPTPLFQYRRAGEKNPPNATKAAGVDINWGGGIPAPASWRWDGKLRLYLRSQRHRPHLDSSGTQLSAKNVVVLVTTYGQSSADTRSPEANTVGNGEAFVYTNGRLIHGHWDRPDVNKPGTLTDDLGKPILLSPGQTFIELPKAGMQTTVA